jgi:PHD/YefM family antitoxin component YafN of YafNO toxin-antitoxin module
MVLLPQMTDGIKPQEEMMSVDLKERFVVDEAGKRVAVLIDIDEYQKVLEALEELESINAYDEAKASNDEIISFSQAVKEIESQSR